MQYEYIIGDSTASEKAPIILIVICWNEKQKDSYPDVPHKIIETNASSQLSYHHHITYPCYHHTNEKHQKSIGIVLWYNVTYTVSYGIILLTHAIIIPTKINRNPSGFVLWYNVTYTVYFGIIVHAMYL